MRIRQFASRATLLALVALLMAARPAEAGDYSPRHLRAEPFLKLRTLDYDPSLQSRMPPRVVPLRLGFDYALDSPLGFGPGALVLRVEAKTKLRRLVKFSVSF